MVQVLVTLCSCVNGKLNVFSLHHLLSNQFGFEASNDIIGTIRLWLIPYVGVTHLMITVVFYGCAVMCQQSREERSCF